MSNFEIYCPHCEYRPTLEDRWSCEPGCGTRWHTFWTRGMCPGCAKHWQVTQCPACEQVSPHRNWYHPRRDRTGSTPQYRTTTT